MDMSLEKYIELQIELTQGRLNRVEQSPVGHKAAQGEYSSKKAKEKDLVSCTSRLATLKEMLLVVKGKEADSKEMHVGSEVVWFDIQELGMPPRELRYREVNGNVLDRQFLVKGEYSIACCYMFDDGSGFDMPEGNTDTPVAWAIVKDF